MELNRQLQQETKYLIRMEPGVQTPEETLEKRSGSCRDSSWLLVQILRNLGLAARFVSGYLLQLTPDVKSLDGPSGTDHDFTDLHAWCEVLSARRRLGRVRSDLRPAHAGKGISRCARRPSPNPPRRFLARSDPCEVEFKHEMRVSRIFETPRVTWPYSDDNWELVDKLGEQIDARLKANDVRLTMGGEPTFVSIDDFQSAEWNTAAVGPTKQALAYTLIQRLRDAFRAAGADHLWPGQVVSR